MATEATHLVDLREALISPPDNVAEAAHWMKQSVYKVPPSVTQLKPEAYHPQVVSFGPYHYGEERLKPMEEHKVRALRHFVNRSRKQDFELLSEALAEVLDDLMACYNPLDQKWRDDREAFLRLMILDGCFMLEILRTWASTPPTHNDYLPSDPIFGKHGELNIKPYVKRDMLMLENQLPMLVLDKLNGTCPEDPTPVEKLIVRLFHCSDIPIPKMGPCLHVLDVLRKSLLQEEPRHGRALDETSITPRSATELHDAGVQLKKSESTSLDAITFRRGVLRLPFIFVDDATESKFLNLLAFERFHVGAGNEVTSYICFMDEIINNERDVALLHSNGILRHGIGSDKAVADLFNSLSKEVTPDPGSSIEEVREQLSNYCRSYYRKWRANLCDTYCSSPWKVLSIIAAIILFALTITQTVYTVLQLYQS